MLDAIDGDPEGEDDERGSVLMIAPGNDYDPADDDSAPDGLPGVPEDAEDDDGDCCSARDDDPGFYISDVRGLPGDPDDAEVAYTEWNTRGRHKLSHGGEQRPGLRGWPIGEDDEDDDRDTSIEDDRRGFDPESDLGVDDFGEQEHEQIHDDVPMLPVFAIEPDSETGKRPLLGHLNLQSSYGSLGGEIATDTGGVHWRAIWPDEIGVPV
ncbi:hypothetical protein [Sphingomonas oligophenolica]|nr:hypothetical protein [Sphingomonas oligophenolica]